jgi:hypothetical protein
MPSLVFGLVLLVLGLAGLGVGLWGLNEVRRDSDWIEVTAKVESIEAGPYEYDFQRSGGGSGTATGWRMKILYSYEIDGVRHDGDRYSRYEEFDDYSSSQYELGQKRTEALRKRGTIPAWVDPDDHDSAVLALPELAPAIAVGVAGIIVLGVAGFLLLRFRRISRQAEADDEADALA